MTTQTEMVTIVVPVRNRAGQLIDTLRSIAAQTYSHLHLIVVDNGSTDNTAESARHWANKEFCEPWRKFTLISELKPGASAARNAGLKITETDKILFFDSDDLMHPDLITKAMQVFNVHPEIEMVTWPMNIHFQNGRIKRTYTAPFNLLERHIINAILSTQQYMARTELFQRVGGWNEELPGWNDWELGVRIMLQNPKRVALQKPLVEYKRNDDSITGPNYSSGAGKWELAILAVEKVLKEEYSKPCNQNRELSAGSKNEKVNARTLRLMAYRRVILAASYAREGAGELAEPLFKQGLNAVGRFRRPIYRFIYEYTKRGGRGVYFLTSKLL